MSLPSNVQFALDALNQVGARLKAAKASGDDVTSILQEYKILQTTLENVIRPLANSNKGTNFFWVLARQCARLPHREVPPGEALS